MTLPPDQATALAGFPQVLRDLVHAELATGDAHRALRELGAIDAELTKAQTLLTDTVGKFNALARGGNVPHVLVETGAAK